MGGDRVIALRADPPDLRDQVFLPSLRPLAARGDPVGVMRPDDPAPYPLRHQGRDGLCVGFALANLIDLHRAASAGPGDDPGRMSARMIYEMARRLERRGPQDPDGVRSLRSAIKAFYHYGCCPQDLWPDDAGPGDDGDDPTIARFKAARGVTLGAYYRVRPMLNDYHSALMEADGILVSAMIHDGWHQDHLYRADAPPEIRGRIPPSREETGAHAFVILGYDPEGFLVLNSWGDGWGHHGGRPGIALWPYADWARNVLDAWVLRLGVPAPGAFPFSIGDQGISFGDFDIRAPAAACHHLLGHFAHLDDGDHVVTGSHASSRRSVALTAGLLRARPEAQRGRVMLRIGGSLMGFKEAFDIETRRRRQVGHIRDLYPYALLWCADLMESVTPVLTRIFEAAVERVGPHGPTLAAQIERDAAGMGRAFWRELRRSARKAGRHGSPDGAAADLFDRMAGTGAPLHLVVEGAGAMVLIAYLQGLSLRQGLTEGERVRRGLLRRRFLGAVASIDLIAPPVPCAELAVLSDLIRAVPGHAAIWVPSPDFEARLAMGHYAGSLLDLVANSFADDRGTPLAGMAAERSGIMALTRPGGTLQGLEVRTIAVPDPQRRRFEQHEIGLDRACQAAILDRLAAWPPATRMT